MLCEVLSLRYVDGLVFSGRPAAAGDLAVTVTAWEAQGGRDVIEKRDFSREIPDFPQNFFWFKVWGLRFWV